MEKGVPVPSRLSLDFQQELLENTDQIYHLNSYIHNGNSMKDAAIGYIRKEGRLLVERYNKICYYTMSHFLEDIPEYPLNEAALLGDVDIFEELVSVGFDPKVSNHDILVAGCKGEPPICCAARKGRLEVVRLLVEVHGVSVNEKDGRFGDTPLHYAAEEGNLETVQYLVEKGARVNAVNNLQNLPIVSALRFHNVTQYLIANGTNVKIMDNTELTLLYFACTICRNLETIKLILEAEANVHTASRLSSETTFCVAAGRNWLELMKLLRSYGANPEIGDVYGYTPLHRTTRHRDIKCAKYLLVDLCVSLDKKWLGKTAFTMAADDGNANFLHLLLDVGYDPANENCIYHCEKEDLADVMKRARLIASNPRSLQDLSCFKVRQILGRNVKRDIDELNLPTVLKDMIQLNHVVSLYERK